MLRILKIDQTEVNSGFASVKLCDLDKTVDVFKLVSYCTTIVAVRFVIKEEMPIA